MIPHHLMLFSWSFYRRENILVNVEGTVHSPLSLQLPGKKGGKGYPCLFHRKETGMRDSVQGKDETHWPARGPICNQDSNQN